MSYAIKESYTESNLRDLILYNLEKIFPDTNLKRKEIAPIFLFCNNLDKHFAGPVGIKYRDLSRIDICSSTKSNKIRIIEVKKSKVRHADNAAAQILRYAMNLCQTGSDPEKLEMSIVFDHEAPKSLKQFVEFYDLPILVIENVLRLLKGDTDGQTNKI